MRLHHLALRSHDPERCARFYHEVFGLRERARHHEPGGALRSIWLDAQGVVLMVERAAAGEPLPSAAAMDLVAFGIAPTEREGFRTRFAAAGVLVEGETAHTLYVRDPDGRRVGVSSYPFG